MPAFVWTLRAVQLSAAVALLLNALGGVVEPGAAPVYASALTAMLVASGSAYLLALSVIPPELTKRTR